MTDPALLSAEALLALFARRALSPIEALQAISERIARDNPHINAFACLNPQALTAAGESEARWMAGRALGPLDGVPVTVKDLLNVAGFPTRRGSRTTSAEPAVEDAPAVTGLRAAGAVILGKTTTTEFGFPATARCTASPATRSIAGARRAARPPARRRPVRPGSGRCMSPPTRAAPSASRRPIAAWSV